jgi:hypothetical protein
MVTRQGVALAVSLDITNAFNTIPWDRIIEALRHCQVPKYSVEVIKTYLSDRWVEFSSQRGMEKRPVERGVPQGSVLGPILWITAYYRVLRSPRPLGTDLVCYADDTLVLIRGRWWHETANLTEDAVACVTREIKRLGLRVSPAKSEVLGFYNSRHRGPPPPGLAVSISGERVMVGQQMKYLGLTIDSQWTFSMPVDSLLPYLRGAGLGVRRLYDGVVRSRVLYGAPVWVEELSASRRSLALVMGLHRVMAIRIIRGYRTVSRFELQALALKERYEGKQALLQEGPEETLQPVDLGEIENHTWRRWCTQLEEEDRARPHWAIRAVLPNWETWRNQKGAPLTFRMTQILTGHGVFGGNSCYV